ncbi:MAG: 3-isopropylmalate dehydratase small subunit [Candidatus Gracilibacteria bacterium]
MKTIKSIIIPIPRKDIDTDIIIPASNLKTTTKIGLSAYLFQGLRLMYENFPFNLKKYDAAKIMVTRENFGCGSSREHAAWAISDWGIKAIIAPSFSNIFYGNALKNGILPITLSDKIVEKIFKDEKKVKTYEIEIDIPKQEITLPDGKKFSFEIDPYRKNCLMEGIDDMDYLFKNISKINKFKKKQKLFFNLSQVGNTKSLFLAGTA